MIRIVTNGQAYYSVAPQTEAAWHELLSAIARKVGISLQFRMQARLERDPTRMQLRRQTAEHPFGTIKAWMGATHFLSRRLPRSHRTVDNVGASDTDRAIFPAIERELKFPN